MEDEDLIRRNRALLTEAEAARETARQSAAELLDTRCAAQRQHRLSRLIWARKLRPRFARRLHRSKLRSL